MNLNRKMKLGLLSVVAAFALVGCDDSDSNSNDNSGNSNVNTGYKAQFLNKSAGDQVEELMGGVIGIADEVGNGKMGDPLGEDLASADTTLVESQFSWNSTMDFYNNIASIKHVWDGGLKDVVAAHDNAKATQITNDIATALNSIIAISDSNSDGKLTTSDLIANDGAKAFRNQISNADGRTLITTATTKLATLQTDLESLKTYLSSVTFTDADKTECSNVVNNVIVTGYNDLGVEAQKLSAALTKLKDAPTAANVTAARAQWRATREFWEAGEGHIFGPVDTLGVDPKVDSWPVDKVQLDGALDGWDPELSNIDGFPTTMKGFHAIEYLLFGDGSAPESANNALNRLGDTKRAYLEALGVSFAKDIKSLTDAWK